MSEVPCLSDIYQDRNGICDLPRGAYPKEKKKKSKRKAKKEVIMPNPDFQYQPGDR
jgi:hypothetical protein